ncbi:hypothetical protein CEXT_627281 [Caerostris extrusa]|uniref:Uncharacterized protein n=1 Tax=Caerostris extrusa TaxID=172846 RepID=A0AAV4R2I8_CAEEX|nr:hypothetical protein CEXT_627281 [Caerostris extrusa]
MEFDIAKKTIQELHRLLSVSSAKMNSDLVSMSLDFIDDVLVDIHKILEINKLYPYRRKMALNFADKILRRMDNFLSHYWPAVERLKTQKLTFHV